MHSIFHFVTYNLKRIFSSPRPYITFIIIFVIMRIGFGGCRTYLAENSQMFQAVELYVFSHNSNVFLEYFTLGLLLLLGDAPFLKVGMSMRLIRTNRIQWLIGQILSCIIISAIYLIIIELPFLILFCDHISFQNEWSAPVALAAQFGNGMAINMDMAIPFSMSILQAGSPYAMFGLTFLYNLLLYTFFSMVLIACNLRFRSGIGSFMVLAFVGMKLILYYVFYSKLLCYLSPCTLASLSERPITSINILYTVMFLLVSSCCLGVLSLRFVKEADLVRGDYS